MRVEVAKERAAWARYRKYIVRHIVGRLVFEGDDESRRRFMEWRAAREAREASSG